MIGATNSLEHGWQSFQRGDLAHAEQIAHQAIERDANRVDGWFLRAIVHHVRGEHAAARELYESALALQPDHFGALNNLGVIYASAGRHHDALAVIANYLRIDPDNAVANCNYANSLDGLGRSDEAANYYRRALAQQPDFLDALNNFGAMLIAHNKAQEALPYCRRACAIQPDSSQTNNNLGLAYSLLQQYDVALFHLREAVRFNPQSYEALTNLGDLFAKRKDFASAIACHRQAVPLRPNEATALDKLGLALLEHGQHLEALDCLRRALELDPNLASAHCSLGKALIELCRLDEAETHLREALRICPELAHAHNLLGMIAFHRGDDDASQRCFDEALKCAPNHLHAQMNRTFLRLRQGDLARGLADYELRFAADESTGTPCPAPRWDGSDLGGRTVLVRAEQGRGDILQFLRYLPLVRAKGGRVVCEIQSGLHPLIARSGGYDALVAMGAPLPPVDVQIPMMSLPHVLGSIDAPVPYLHADPRLVETWGRELNEIEGFKIGIAWQGDPRFRFDPLRSIPLEQFEPLARIPGARLISVQKHDGVDQIAANRERVPLVDFGARLDEAAGSFMDSAAIMMNLDLVVTSDTATAHLAGALGVPTWMPIAVGPDWRWFREREDSPWYPTMRLFRQSRLGDWGDVFARLATALRQEMARRDALASAFFVPMSPGELLDKFSILQIKSERLTNPAQIRNVRTEIRMLDQHRQHLLAGSESIGAFAAQLKKVNESLWQIEEELRSCECAQDFGPHFVELARSVYKHNDRRAALKRKINISLGSTLHEEKTHLLPNDT